MTISSDDQRDFVQFLGRLQETQTLLAVGEALSLRLEAPEAMRRVAREVALAFGAAPSAACFSAQRSAPSTTSAYSGICAAAVMSDGLVVASRGLNFSIDFRSPVSQTTTVIALN